VYTYAYGYVCFYNYTVVNVYIYIFPGAFWKPTGSTNSRHWFCFACVCILGDALGVGHFSLGKARQSLGRTEAAGAEGWKVMGIGVWGNLMGGKYM